MGIFKKKAFEEETETEHQSQEKKPRKRVETTGSRWGAVALLIITVLASVGFYLYGWFMRSGVEFRFDEGESSNTYDWEFQKD